jgi:hypothetical protein
MSRVSNSQSQQANFSSPSAAPITATYSVVSNNSAAGDNNNGNQSSVGQIAADLVELNQSGRLNVSQAVL